MVFPFTGLMNNASYFIVDQAYMNCYDKTSDYRTIIKTLFYLHSRITQRYEASLNKMNKNQT